MSFRAPSKSRTRIADLARQIAGDFRERPVTIVGVLTGSLMFLADLVRHLDLPLRIGLIQASSYRGATTTAGALHVAPELLPDVHGRHVLLLDDILDTGPNAQLLGAAFARPGNRLAAGRSVVAQDRPPTKDTSTRLRRFRYS